MKAFYSRHSLVILMIFAFLGPLMVAGTRRALWSNSNDVKAWLPPDYPETADFNWYWERFPSDAFILVSWEGATLEDPRLELMARKLAAVEDVPGDPRTVYFGSVTTGKRLVDMLVEKQGLSPEAAVERLKGSIIGPDGKHTALLLTVSPYAVALNKQGGDPREYRRFTHATVDKVYEVAEGQCAIPREELHLGGPLVDNVAIDQEGERMILRLAAMSAVVGLGISYLCLRSWRLTWIVFFTALFSAGLSLSAVFYSGAKMNAILLTMPALVYVAATSGAIHLANYYRDAARHHGIVGATDRAVKGAWLPLALATGTTAIGLASLAISELKPIEMFGIFSAVGVVASFIVLLTFMPAALEMWPPRNLTVLGEEPRAAGRSAAFFRRAGRLIIEKHGWVTAACLALLGVGVYGMFQIQTSVKLMRFFSPKSQIIADYTWLEEKLGPLVPMEVVLRVDREKTTLDMLAQMQMVAHVQRAIADMPEVGSALAAPTFAPALPVRAGMLRRGTWNTILERNTEALGEYLKVDEQERVWRISARVPALTDLDYGYFVRDIRAVVEPILEEYRARGVEGVSAVYTGVVPVVYKAQHSMFDGLKWGMLGDLALIGLAMVVLVRNLSSGLLLMLASIFPLGIVFGAMGLFGWVVDTGTVMAPAVALGVTVDDAIHFMLWCRHGRQRGLSKPDSIMFAYDDCARAIYQSWGVIGIGLFCFAFSNFMPTQRFGILMLAMLSFSSFANLVFLPALLAGPLGRFFWRGTAPAEATTLEVARPQPVLVESEAAVACTGREPRGTATVPHRLGVRAGSPRLSVQEEG